MRRICQYILLACAGILFVPAASAQEQHPWALSCEPLYLLNHGMRISLERKMNARDWAGINLTGYNISHDPDTYGQWTSNSDFNRIGALKGFGIGGTYKRYFFRKLFVNLGAGYTYYDVRKKAPGYEPFSEDGLTFYRYDEIDQHSFFNKIMTNASVGIHSTFRHAFFAEPYFGVGMAYSFYDRSYTEKYNETMFGFGHRGFYWVLGVKLGFNLPRSR
jgi:hypothetical protein